MPILQAQNISFILPSGEALFASLSFSLTSKRVGLVGRNGAGKSVLGSILSGDISPATGNVISSGKTGMFSQQPTALLNSSMTIADTLGVASVLRALKQIASGNCDPHWFDTIGENWDLPEQLANQLSALGLPQDLSVQCKSLSGGQLAKLQLWQLFQSDCKVLILDEPSNHLDSRGKAWLREQIATSAAAVLLISHDRELLNDMDEICELNELGITRYGGNYTYYTEQKMLAERALCRQLDAVSKQQKQLQRQAQLDHEKAQQRASQGSKLRGSQAKCLLDKQKDRASASAANRSKNTLARQHLLQQKAALLGSKKAHSHQQNLYLGACETQNKTAIRLHQGVLCHGVKHPISLTLSMKDKVHLTGENGAGKSTLLKTLMGEIRLKAGEVSTNTPLYYLDQHFKVVNERLTLLENVLDQCRGMSESDARTLLAGIGFRGERVFVLAGKLSGGEKMKLAMIIVSHQPERPFLLLDEPDNHLDIESKISLATALASYAGGFIMISHDEIFAGEAGCNGQYGL